ncbi:MAG: hypothetical protein HYS17_08870 [Micavibrio aeruginosavorus]|uniref:Uncharacterized protein n=1 Tax=Micavibrio aeruginosavorus TaxID=349221 RepID=A0A7T5UG91_9BACT|nr:MAG: hypothetical protein HYS17_08870 [Micavibrio aeruginosavorus]
MIARHLLLTALVSCLIWLPANKFAQAEDRMAGPNPVASTSEARKQESPVYRYRETDDRMGGSAKAKAALQRNGGQKPDSHSDKKSTPDKAAATKRTVRPDTPKENIHSEPDDNKAAGTTQSPADKPGKAAVDSPASAGPNIPVPAMETTAEAAGSPEENNDYIVKRGDKPARVPAQLKVNYTTLESLGTLHNAAAGSLGIDLWDGSSRNNILTLVNQLPPPRHYGILQRMNHRALLTSADATLMSNRSSIQAGEDFQTLRIEKLLDTGAYLQASQLFMTDQAVAYHERLARAGVQSLFLSRQPTIACLETKTMMVRFDEQPFWKQASVICDYILGKMAGQNMKNFVDRPEVKPVAAESRVLGYTFDKAGYKVTPRSFDDLKDFTPLEIAALLNDDRLMLNKFNIDNIREAPSHNIGVLMMSPNAPSEVKLALWDEAIRRGMLSPQELGTLYNEIKLESKDLQQAKGWLALPAYHQAMTAARDKDQKKKLGHEALRLAGQFPPGTLTPFAPYIDTLSAEDADPTLVRKIATIGLVAGTPLSASLERQLWNQAESEGAGQSALYLAIANAALQNFSTEEMPKPDVFQELIGKLPETSKTLIFTIIEKLDMTGKLHNISGKEAYEKQDGLTDPADYDYVMPSSDLMENLTSAHQDKRLGEVILLSAIALGDIPPSRMDPAVLAEVIDGLKTVGLTSEARELASEVVMGLSTGK